MADSQASDAKAQQTLDLVDQLKQDFSPRNKLYQEIERTVYLKREPKVPVAYESTTIKTKSPLPLHIINTITAALSINPPKTQFDPVQIGTTGEENASLREHFFDASWQRQQEEAKSPVFRRFTHATVMKGEGVIKTVERTKRAWAGYGAYSKKLDAQLSDPADETYGSVAKATKAGDYTERDRIYNARTEEKKREMPYPIASQDIAPETFLYIRGENGFSYCAEAKKVPYYEALTRLGMSLDKNGHVVPNKAPDSAAMGVAQHDWHRVMSGTTMLDMVEGWDWQTCTYLLAGPGDDKGKFVRSFKHGYGDPYLKTLRGPYFHAFGITTSSNDVDLMGLSVLYGFLDLFPQLDSLLTILGQSAYKYGYATFRRKAGPTTLERPGAAAFGRDEQDRRNQQSQEITTGGILPWDIEPVNLPSSGPDLEKAVTIFRQLIELALPSIVQGVVQGDESGYLMNQATHLARLVWDPIVSNMSVALAERTGFESWLIENKVKEKVYVWGEQVQGAAQGKRRGYWLGIGPDDIRGVHRYKVNLDVATPSNKVIELRAHDEALKMGVETKAQAITDLGRNPDEVEEGLLLERVKDALTPQVVQATVQEIASIQQQKAQAANDAEQAANPEPQPAGQGFGGLPDVHEAGQNMPVNPTPPGNPEVPNVPSGAMALPGQGG